MSDYVPTTLTLPLCWNPDEMAHLRLDDSLDAEYSESSAASPSNNATTGARGGQDEEERKRKNREAARRVRNKVNKKQTDVKQEIMRLSAEQRASEYEVLLAAKQLTDLINEAEKHGINCGFQYKVDLPTMAPHVQKLAPVQDLIKMTRRPQRRVVDSHYATPTIQPATTPLVIQVERQGGKRNHEEGQVTNAVESRTIKKLKKLIDIGIQHRHLRGNEPIATAFSRDLSTPKSGIPFKGDMEAGPSSRISAPYAFPAATLQQQPFGNASTAPQQFGQSTEDPNLLLSVVQHYRTRSESSCANNACQVTTNSDSTLTASQCDIRPTSQRNQPPPYNAYGNTARVALPETSLSTIVSTQLPAPTGQIPDWSMLADTSAPVENAVAATMPEYIPAPEPVTIHTRQPLAGTMLQQPGITYTTQEDEAVDRIKKDLMNPFAVADQMPQTLLETSVTSASGGVGQGNQILEPLGAGLNTWNPNLVSQYQNYSFDNFGEMIANGMQTANGHDF